MSDTDIVVAGISLRQLAEVCGSPAVHSAATVVPHSGGRPDPDLQTAVLVTRVLAMTEHVSGVRAIQVDARLDNLRLVSSETRRVGGRIGTRTKLCLLVRKPSAEDLSTTRDVLAVDLPANIELGDLLAIPSRPITTRTARDRHPLTGRRDWSPDTIFPDGTRSNRWWESID